MYLDGSVYRGRKPIHWCKNCHTALAEAEIEYSNETSSSLYVRFKMDSIPDAFARAGLKENPVGADLDNHRVDASCKCGSVCGSSCALRMRACAKSCYADGARTC